MTLSSASVDVPLNGSLFRRAIVLALSRNSPFSLVKTAPAAMFVWYHATSLVVNAVSHACSSAVTACSAVWAAGLACADARPGTRTPTSATMTTRAKSLFICHSFDGQRSIRGGSASDPCLHCYWIASAGRTTILTEPACDSKEHRASGLGPSDHG